MREELRRFGFLYFAEGILPMSIVRIIPNFVFKTVDYFFFQK